MATVRKEDALSVLPAVAGPPTSQTGLTKEEVNRYRRHLVLPEVGREGQRRLKNAQVLIVGAGGRGGALPGGTRFL